MLLLGFFLEAQLSFPFQLGISLVKGIWTSFSNEEHKGCIYNESWIKVLLKYLQKCFNIQKTHEEMLKHH